MVIKRIMKMLKMCDIFGSQASFRINGSSKFQSALGGILSIIVYALMILLTIMFGRDCFERKNPRVITQDIIYESTGNFNLTNDEFAIIIQPQLASILKYQVEHATYFVDSAEMKRIDLDLKLCNHSVFKQNPYIPETLDYNTFDYMCADWEASEKKAVKEGYYKPGEHFKLEGNWEGSPVVSWLSYVIYCDDPICNNSTEANRIVSSSRNFFAFFYPTFGVNPELRQPLGKYIKMFSREISFNQKIIAGSYFSISEFWDDLGFIFESFSVYKAVSLVNLDSETMVRPLNSVDMFLYDMTSYAGSSSKKFMRKYMKLQELGAIVGGILKSLITTMRIITYVFNDYFIGYLTYSELALKIPKFQKLDTQMNKQKNTHLSQNYVQDVSDNTAKQISEVPVSNVLNIPSKQNSKVETKMSMCLFFMSYCKCCISLETKKKRKLYDEKLLSIKAKYDLLNYLKLVDMFEDLMCFLFTPQQLQAFYRQGLKDKSDKSSMFKIREEDPNNNQNSSKFVEMVQYFKGKMESSEMSEFDQKLFENLDMTTKSQIAK